MRECVYSDVQTLLAKKMLFEVPYRIVHSVSSTYLGQLVLYERQSLETDRNHTHVYDPVLQHPFFYRRVRLIEIILVFDPVLQHPWCKVQKSTACSNHTLE